jgi:hypothetical protein
MVAMHMMQATIHQIIHMIAMRDLLMLAACMTATRAAHLLAFLRILGADSNHVLIIVIAMRVMQVPFMQVIEMPFMQNGCMSTL